MEVVNGTAPSCPKSIEDYNYLVSRRKIKKHLEFIEISSDGSLLLGCSNLCGRCLTGSIWLFKDPTKAPNEENSLTNFELSSCVSNGVFIGTSNKVLVSEDSGTIQVLSLEENFGNNPFLKVEHASYDENDDSYTSVQVTADHKSFITGGHDSSVKKWDIDTFAVERRYSPCHSHIITSVSTHPTDSNLFITTSLDRTCLLWDTRCELPATALYTASVGGSSSSCLHDTQAVLGTVNGCVYQLDTRMSSVLCGDQSFKRTIRRIKPDPEGRCIAVCADDNVVKVLSADESLKSIYTSEQHSDFVTGIAWDPSSKYLYSCGWDKQVYHHIVDIGDQKTTISESVIDSQNIINDAQKTIQCAQAQSVQQTNTIDCLT